MVVATQKVSVAPKRVTERAARPAVLEAARAVAEVRAGRQVLAGLVELVELVAPAAPAAPATPEQVAQAGRAAALVCSAA
jgi:hypothetical protein